MKYITFLKGVYPNMDTAALSDTIDDAIMKGIDLITQERDDYHQVIIAEISDELGPLKWIKEIIRRDSNERWEKVDGVERRVHDGSEITVKDYDRT